MTAPIDLKQYGRGSFKIIMPRVYSRTPRKEWIINPSLLIFLISITVIFIINHTLLDKNLYKRTRTTVILPHSERVPEPTVPKSLPLIKVLKNAAKKSIEPKKIELEKMLPEKIEEPKPLDKPIPEKKIDALKPLENRIEAKVIDPAHPLPKAIAEKSIIPKEMIAKPLVAREIQPRNIPINNRIAPSISPKLSSIPVAAPAPTPRALPSGSSFNAMPEIKRNVTVSPSGERMAAPPVSSIPASKGPKPEFTQYESYRPPVRSGSSSSGVSSSPSLSSIPKRSIPASPVSVPINHIAPSRNSETVVEELVINSKALGSSERVKVLKQDIMKKARKLSAANSPYIYKVKGYTCKLTIEQDSDSKKVTIDFTPADAPFEVVSALERTIR